jgi:hypothetical protein
MARFIKITETGEYRAPIAGEMYMHSFPEDPGFSFCVWKMLLSNGPRDCEAHIVEVEVGDTSQPVHGDAKQRLRRLIELAYHATAGSKEWKQLYSQLDHEALGVFAYCCDAGFEWRDLEDLAPQGQLHEKYLNAAKAGELVD